MTRATDSAAPGTAHLLLHIRLTALGSVNSGCTIAERIEGQLMSL